MNALDCIRNFNKHWKSNNVALPFLSFVIVSVIIFLGFKDSAKFPSKFDNLSQEVNSDVSDSFPGDEDGEYHKAIERERLDDGNINQVIQAASETLKPADSDVSVTLTNKPDMLSQIEKTRESVNIVGKVKEPMIEKYVSNKIGNSIENSKHLMTANFTSKGRPLRCFLLHYGDFDEVLEHALINKCSFLTNRHIIARTGNQMFQVAAVIGLAHRYDMIPIIQDVKPITDTFDLPNRSNY